MLVCWKEVVLEAGDEASWVAEVAFDAAQAMVVGHLGAERVLMWL